MFQIEQSTFLHALGYAIAHSIWQMSVLWLFYRLFIHLFRWNSSQRYNLAVVTATLGFIWFVSTLVYLTSQLAFEADVANNEVDVDGAATLSGSQKLFIYYHSFVNTLKGLAPYLSCAYLAVMSLLGVRLVNGFQQVKQLRTTGISKPSVEWKLFIKKYAAHLNIKKPVHLFISNVATSPVTIGFLKPIILVPVACINQLTTAQVEAILLHELAHIRRYDYLVNMLLQLAEITLFFNPFMRVLLKQARLERENSCDDYVLQFQYNAGDYARALLAIEKQSMESLLALGSNCKNEFQLLNRIRRMVSPERKSFNYRQQLGLLFLITLLGLGFTALSPRQVVQQNGTVEKNISTSYSLVRDSTIASANHIENFEEFLQRVKANVGKSLANKKRTNNETSSSITDISSNSITGIVHNVEVKTDQTNYMMLPGFQIDVKSADIEKQMIDAQLAKEKVFDEINAVKELRRESFPNQAFVFNSDTWSVYKELESSHYNVLNNNEIPEQILNNLKEEKNKAELRLAQNKKIMVRNVLIADSLRALAEMARKNVSKDADKYKREMDRLRKAIAIAPFRQDAEISVFQYDDRNEEKVFSNDQRKDETRFLVKTRPQQIAIAGVDNKNTDEIEEETKEVYVVKGRLYITQSNKPKATPAVPDESKHVLIQPTSPSAKSLKGGGSKVYSVQQENPFEVNIGNQNLNNTVIGYSIEAPVKELKNKMPELETFHLSSDLNVMNNAMELLIELKVK